MSTNLTREQISAFVDGETSDEHIDIALAALRDESGRSTWNLYHQIGDALHSDELNVRMSADFNARLFARLEAEPTVIAPVGKPRQQAYRRFAMPGMAAAAVAVIAVLTVPKVMQQNDPASASASGAPAQTIASASPQAQPRTITVASQNGEVLRDPRIDEYLLAHQGFSPSLYSTAQYARSAAFDVESDK